MHVRYGALIGSCTSAITTSLIRLLINFELAISAAKGRREDPRADNETLAATAKAALSRMKVILGTVEAISNSIKETVERVAKQSSAAIRITGFSSLPDDMVARIFELHHERHNDTMSLGPQFATIRSSNVMASVCTRFRRIALRIPSLWGEASDHHGSEWIANLKERSQNPSVYINFFSSKSKRTATDFIQLLHPSKQWKGLHVRYHNESDGHSVFEHISKMFDGDLGQLKSLTLSHDWYHWFGQDEEIEVEPPSTMLSEVDEEHLSKWKLRNLENLELMNIIPYGLLCFGLKECAITLSRSDPSFRWDLLALKIFLGRLHNLESLSLTFSGARTPSRAVEHDDAEPTILRRLTSLIVNIQYCTEEGFVKEVMDMLDAPLLSKMNISLQYNSDDNEEPGPSAWLDAIFKSSPCAIRTFPNVEECHLSVKDDVRHLPYEAVLRAIPRVRDLTLDLPQCAEPSFDDLGENYGCLRDLHALRLRNCADMHGHSVSSFIENLHEHEKLKQIDELEVEGCRNVATSKGSLEKLLGDKFVWKE